MFLNVSEMLHNAGFSFQDFFSPSENQQVIKIIDSFMLKFVKVLCRHYMFIYGVLYMCVHWDRNNLGALNEALEAVAQKTLNVLQKIKQDLSMH